MTRSSVSERPRYGRAGMVTDLRKPMPGTRSAFARRARMTPPNWWMAAYLRANLDRAKLHKLRQFRYIRFLKTDWIKRLRMPILPYPKRQPD